jgi:ssDNA-binding Zn-finger/Zn-ribbon topoisomerase 1
MGNTNIDGRCPRCGGKIIVDWDIYGWYEQCLQCSFTRDLKVIYQKKVEPVAAKKDET